MNRIVNMLGAIVVELRRIADELEKFNARELKISIRQNREVFYG